MKKQIQTLKGLVSDSYISQINNELKKTHICATCSNNNENNICSLSNNNTLIVKDSIFSCDYYSKFKYKKTNFLTKILKMFKRRRF